MPSKVNLPSNRAIIIVQGFSFFAGISIAEPSTVMPLIVSYFSDSNFLVGLYSSLLTGGSIIMQLYTAYHAQSLPQVIFNFRIVLLIRFLAWFSIGLSLYVFGQTSPHLALALFGIFLFTFSFMSGFGNIYFQELLGKSFSNGYRGKVLALRQLFGRIGSIVSGGFTASILANFAEPISFAYLFIFSSIVLLAGYILLAIFKEEKKENVMVKEPSFKHFIHNAYRILKGDVMLQKQIISRLISYAYLFATPFIILDAKKYFDIDGAFVGIAVSVQMTGAMVGNLIWAKFTTSRNRLIVSLSFSLSIIAMLLSLTHISLLLYYFIFFLIGASIDGFALGFDNLILMSAPEAKRPIYIAIQNNITFVGMFFSIFGSLILNATNFQTLIIFSSIIAAYGFYTSRKL